MFDLARLMRRRPRNVAGRAAKGLLGGVLLLLAAAGLQFWNEGRTHRRDGMLSEARAQVLSLAAPEVVAANEGRLVHFVGDARNARVVDETFGIEVPGLALRRRVEMYQWRENKQQREVDGRKTTSYSYSAAWSDRTIDSRRFDDGDTHANPERFPFERATFDAEQVQVGGFHLRGDALRRLGGWQPLAPQSLVLPPNMAASFRAAGDWLSTSNTQEKPEVGDLRVRFDVLPAGTVSVLARQQTDRLLPFVASSGDELLIVRRGQVSAATLLESEASTNTRAAWAFRLVGFALAWTGFGLLFRPLASLAGAVPVLGRVAGVGVALLSALLALLLSVVAIGGGWLWQRPWLIALAMLAVVALALWTWRRRPAASSPRPAAVPPPPPPPPSS